MLPPSVIREGRARRRRCPGARCLAPAGRCAAWPRAARVWRRCGGVARPGHRRGQSGKQHGKRRWGCASLESSVGAGQGQAGSGCCAFLPPPSRLSSACAGRAPHHSARRAREAAHRQERCIASAAWANKREVGGGEMNCPLLEQAPLRCRRPQTPFLPLCFALCPRPSAAAPGCCCGRQSSAGGGEDAPWTRLCLPCRCGGPSLLRLAALRPSLLCSRPRVWPSTPSLQCCSVFPHARCSRISSASCVTRVCHRGHFF